MHPYTNKKQTISKQTITKHPLITLQVLLLATAFSLMYGSLLSGCTPLPNSNTSTSLKPISQNQNKQLNTFLNTCEPNMGIQELTSTPSGLGSRYLFILCNNGVRAHLIQP